jgi:hypothetical protein
MTMDKKELMWKQSQYLLRRTNDNYETRNSVRITAAGQDSEWESPYSKADKLLICRPSSTWELNECLVSHPMPITC